MIRKNKNAFTLVELLAVIVILAIILVIAVPKVMDIITDAKKATLESTAKMIASQAEKQKVQNTVLGKEDAITCDSVAQLSKTDYANCSITFSDSDEAKVTIKGSGKFNNLWVCNGTKTSAVATKGGCGLTCNEQEAYVQNVNVTKPYVVEDYDKCMDYLEPIILSDDWGGDEGELIGICKNRIIDYYSFEYLIYDILDGEYFTEEELISNNIVASDSVWETNITAGNYDSCVSYMTEKYIELEWEEFIDEQVPSLCNGEAIWSDSFSSDVQSMIDNNGLTKEELLEKHVIGSDSVFTNIKPGSSCTNKLKDIVVDEWGYTDADLQTICSGKDIDVVTMMDEIAKSGIVSEIELIENNVIEGSIEEEKVCVPDYGNAVTYINNLYNDTNIRNKFGLTKDNTTEQNIRYAGKYVQNYVEFGNTGELWRIIGTFEVETADGDTEELVKIVREENLGYMSWDSSAETINGGYGVNEWSQADLKNMLNGYYLGESSSCTYCNDWKQATCTNSCSNSIIPINSTYKNMIESVVWNTGAIEWNDDELSPLQAYNAERGNTTGKICTQGDTYCNDTVTRTTEWEGKIGLIYPSDFGYAGGSTCTSITSGSCVQNNWSTNRTWYWTISPNAYSGDASGVWSVGYDGASGGSAYNDDGVRAALYLKSNVQIIDGDGSKNNPYKLS